MQIARMHLKLECSRAVGAARQGGIPTQRVGTRVTGVRMKHSRSHALRGNAVKARRAK